MIRFDHVGDFAHESAQSLQFVQRRLTRAAERGDSLNPGDGHCRRLQHGRQNSRRVDLHCHLKSSSVQPARAGALTLPESLPILKCQHTRRISI